MTFHLTHSLYVHSSSIFLLSPAASWITGVELVVDGGAWHIGNNNMLGMTYPDVLDDPLNFRKRMQAKL